MRLPLLAVLLTTTAYAQWDLRTSHTTASLRGIHALGHGVAWASGTEGTVLRTTDDGQTWQICPTPPAAEHLDFRDIQAFDQTTALVMSSGKGDLSRLYKTTDGCKSWKLVFTNPDKDGFWDAIRFIAGINRPDGLVFRTGVIIGDPVDGKFSKFQTSNNGDSWGKSEGPFYPAVARDGEGLFAASNSSLVLTEHAGEIFVTGGKSGSRSRIVSEYVKHDPHVSIKLVGGDIPLTIGSSAGAFSIATSYVANDAEESSAAQKNTVYFFPATALCVVVGGDYLKPDKNLGTAAFSLDGGQHWKPAQTPPHGYRSAVAYSPEHKAWITVGPNGTDLSTDDGATGAPSDPAPPNPRTPTGTGTPSPSPSP